MKNFFVIILFLVGFVSIFAEGPNFFDNVGIDVPYFDYSEEKKLQKTIGVLFCILSIVLFKKVRADKITKKQEKEQKRLRLKNEKHNQWYDSLSEEERVEEDYKKWVENTSSWDQINQEEQLLLQSIDNDLYEFGLIDDKITSGYKYRKLTPLEERIALGSKEVREKEEAEALVRAQEKRDADQERLASDRADEQERIAYEKERKASLHKRFEYDEADKILQGTLWIGMTLEMLLEAKGEPSDILESVSVGKVKKKYLYGMRINRVGNQSFDFEVSLENDVVIGWNDKVI